MSNILNNRLAALAADIRTAHADVRQNAVAMAERAISAGRLLIEAKTAVSHGEWRPWLAANVGMSERTARRYMQLAKSGMETATVADLGIRGAVESVARSSEFNCAYENACQAVYDYLHGGMDAELATLPDEVARLELLCRIRDDAELTKWVSQIVSPRRA